MARKSNTPSNALVERVRALLDDEEVSEDQINRVIVAYEAAHSGDPVGTVLLNPETGATARRVSVDGVHKWRVDDGEVSWDTRPTLEGWTVVRAVEGA